jgi:DNA-binding beta-propeller fold protein YncE
MNRIKWYCVPLIMLILFTPITLFAYTGRVIHEFTHDDVIDGPTGVAIDSSGEFVYFTSSTDGKVWRANLYLMAMDTEMETIELESGSEPAEVVVRPDNERIYVANQADNSIAVIQIDPSTFTNLGAQSIDGTPKGMLFIDTGLEEYLYVVMDDVPSVAAYNRTVTEKEFDYTFQDGTAPFDIAMTPDKETVVVSLEGTGEVAIFAAEGLSGTEIIQVGTSLRGIAVHPNADNTKAYVYCADNSDNSVKRIDIRADDIESTVEEVGVGQGPYDVLATPTHLFVSNETDDSISVIQIDGDDFASSTIDTLSNVVDTPKGLAITEDGRFLVVASFGENSVKVISDGPDLSIPSPEHFYINGTDNNSAPITWQSDLSGEYQIEIGGNGQKDSGGVVGGTPASMSAGENQSDVTSSSFADEGKYYVFIYGWEPTTPATWGRIATQVTYDNTPPTAPTGLNAQPGNGELYLTWTAGSDTLSGIKGYRVYYKIKDSSDMPATFDILNEGNGTLTGLTNETTYTVYLKALDMSGNESTESSNEVNATPEPIPGAIPSDTGCFIDSAHAAFHPQTLVAALAGLLSLAILFFLKRRWGRWVWVLAFVLGCCSWSGEARAQAKSKFNFDGVMMGIKAGYFHPYGDIEESFRDGGFTGSLTATWVNKTNFETTAGIGLIIADDMALTASGSRSNVKEKLSIIPVEFTVRYRFQFTNDQLFIPYLDLGVMACHFRDSLADGRDTTDGFTGGYHGSLGLRFRLKRVDRESLFRTAKIEDIFLTLEGRYSVIDRFGQDDTDMGGLTVTLGLEFKY